MTAAAPKSLSIRTYQVGFGDCFLLSFDYGAREKHVLIDFGSTGLPPGTPASRMMDVAKDIDERTRAKKTDAAGKLTAVVATHRHKDHISGFTTKTGGKGTGDVIAALKPRVVVQPWTENPDIGTKATEGPETAKNLVKHVAMLANMHDVAAQAMAQMRGRRYVSSELKAELGFLGDDNLLNLSAVKNLMKMGPNRYVHAGSKSGLETLLPGVKVHVLGPPTVKQSAAIKKQRSSDPNEFWQFQARAMRAVAAASSRRSGTASLFPRHVRSAGPTFPIAARWLVFHGRSAHANQTLDLVRMLDSAMNNTSVILLFEIKGRFLLFSGDAQIENWSYSLADTKARKLLSQVELYKVGHHGSRNATPKTLWKLFDNRKSSKKAKRSMSSLMSTMAGKHGHKESNTEVPRRTLVTALKSETHLFSTESLSGAAFYKDTTIAF